MRKHHPFNRKLRHRCNSGAAQRDVHHACIGAADPSGPQILARRSHRSCKRLLRSYRYIKGALQAQAFIAPFASASGHRFPDLQALQPTQRCR